MTKIEWTERTWNPITGCTKVSPGCANCYAERMAKRLAGRAGYPEAPRQFEVTPHVDRLRDPLSWRKPSRVFVCSMGDLFHDDVDPYYRGMIWRVMEQANWHTFQVLTKRAENMARIVNDYHARLRGLGDPLPNIWCGVTTENQEQADKRISYLLFTFAAVRFVSVEPMLGPVDLYLTELAAPPGTDEEFVVPAQYKPDWVIIGCESGPKRRPCNIEWMRDLVRQCQAAGVAVFVKQLDLDGRVSKNPDDWPEDLRVREYPDDAT